MLSPACRSAVAYLCGHLHTLGGLMPVLHSRHPHGTLELELGDWMDNRRQVPSSLSRQMRFSIAIHRERRATEVRTVISTQVPGSGL